MTAVPTNIIADQNWKSDSLQVEASSLVKWAQERGMSMGRFVHSGEGMLGREQNDAAGWGLNKQGQHQSHTADKTVWA